MLFLIITLVLATVFLVCFSVIPLATSQVSAAAERRKQKIANNMERLMPRQEATRLSFFMVLAPVVGAAVLLYLSPPEFKLIGGLVGLTVGFMFPNIFIRYLVKRSRDKFTDQLVDALMIMSSSFRGGLSLVQAIEAVVDEMPDPINKEFGLVLGENKMGASLEEAFYHLYARQPSNALQQMITAILLARETGGNLPIIFNRIVGNIRENKKIQQNLDTLTVQGKIQGIVMSMLPIGFAFVVYSTNRRIFENMIHSEMGKAMLMYATFSECIGVYLIWKISTFKDF